MRRLVARVVRVVASFLRPRTVAVQEEICWCGIHHLGDYWHDPTHGRIDRDIQDNVEAQFGPFVTSAERAQRVAIENTMQDRRNRRTTP